MLSTASDLKISLYLPATIILRNWHKGVKQHNTHSLFVSYSQRRNQSSKYFVFLLSGAIQLLPVPRRSGIDKVSISACDRIPRDLNTLQFQTGFDSTEMFISISGRRIHVCLPKCGKFKLHTCWLSSAHPQFSFSLPVECYNILRRFCKWPHFFLSVLQHKYPFWDKFQET